MTLSDPPSLLPSLPLPPLLPVHPPRSVFQAAGAPCRVSPTSSPTPMKSMVTEESIVLVVEDEALGPDEQEWVVRVKSNLTRCVECNVVALPIPFTRKLSDIFPSLLLCHTHSLSNSQNQRPVLDSEIGFALLHTSTDSYYNPGSTDGEPMPGWPATVADKLRSTCTLL